MINIKPCPFCGSESVSLEIKKDFRVSAEYIFDMYCHVCGVSTCGFENPEEAIMAWNRRVSDE